ncbi:MAG: YjbQ family protein [Bacteroidales bacterium]|nr:YjbQ family protein [Bacteroidales bacterium]
MITQKKIHLKARKRGFHLITDEILKHIDSLPETGLLNLFLHHTSAGLSINENCDPTVRYDMETIANSLVPDSTTHYEHSLEGQDDMPAHFKSSMFGASITIPISEHKLSLGTWQGIYLCEFRNYGGERLVTITIYN